MKIKKTYKTRMTIQGMKMKFNKEIEILNKT